VLLARVVIVVRLFEDTGFNSILTCVSLKLSPRVEDWGFREGDECSLLLDGGRDCDGGSLPNCGACGRIGGRLSGSDSDSDSDSMPLWSAGGIEGLLLAGGGFPVPLWKTCQQLDDSRPASI